MADWVQKAIGRLQGGEKYSADQPRVPSGSSEGGQFASGGGASVSKIGEPPKEYQASFDGGKRQEEQTYAHLRIFPAMRGKFETGVRAHRGGLEMQQKIIDRVRKSRGSRRKAQLHSELTRYWRQAGQLAAIEEMLADL